MNSYRSPSDSFPGPLLEARAASTAGGGTALSTTAAIVGFPLRSTHATLIARNFQTAVVCKYAINPYLLLLKTTNGDVAFTDYSRAVQQNPATASAMSMNAQPTYVNGGALYVGAGLPFRGFAVTMSGNVNAIAAVMTVEYWNGAWTAVSGFSDGTSAAGATLAQTGNVTFTVPTDWATSILPNDITNYQQQVDGPAGWQGIPGQASPVPQSQFNAMVPYSDRPRYWTRVTVSAALSATVGINSVFALNRSTAYAEMLGNSLTQFRVQGGPDGVSCVEALVDAGTGNLIVDCYVANAPQQFA